MSRPFVVLSLSGGGYCGLYTAAILAAIEETRGAPLHKSVDLFAGTSAGGILALGLAHGKSAAELRDILQEKGPSIFGDAGNWLQRFGANRWADTRQLVSSKYSTKPLEDAISSMIGESAFTETKRPTLIPAVSVTAGRPHVFRNYGDRELGLKSIDVALATSAAPTFFAPHHIGTNSFVDGGIVANSPDMVAIGDAVKYFRQDLSNIFVVSIGALNADVSSPSVKAGFNGLLGSVSKVRESIDFVMEIQERLAQMTAEQMLGGNYVRLTKRPNDRVRKHVGLDRARASATATLLALANQTFDEKKLTPPMKVLLNGNLQAPERWGNGSFVFSGLF